MITYKNLIQNTWHFLKKQINYHKNYESFFYDITKLICFFKKWTLAQLYQNQTIEIDLNLTLFNEVLDTYIKGKPIAYIINEINFYGNKFYVNEDVLIPRSVTEQLVSEIIYLAKNKFLNQKLVIFDIGTGCGAIGLSLAKALPEAHIYASDLNNNVLNIAKKNQKRLNIKNITFLKGDILQPFIDKNLNCDILVCNPPYISYESNDVQKEVIEYEPHLALFSKNNGCYFYDTILQNYNKICKNKFIIGFEIGFDQHNYLLNLVNKKFFNQNFYFLKDIKNLWRNLFILS